MGFPTQKQPNVECVYGNRHYLISCPNEAWLWGFERHDGMMFDCKKREGLGLICAVLHVHICMCFLSVH